MADGSVTLLAGFWSRNAAIVGTSAAAAHDPILEPSQRATFAAAGRRWVFYTDGTNLVFRSSTDGVAWSADTTVRACVKGDRFAIHFDGTYVHYAYASPVAGASGGIWYRRGAPQSNGTITWSAVEQKPAEPGEPGNVFLTPSVSVDSSGYPWIVWVLYDDDGPTYRLYCIRSYNNDGTWSGAEGGGSLASGMDSTSCPRLVPLRARRMYCLYDKSGEILGKLFSGITNPTLWGSEEDTGADIAASRLYDAVSYLDHVHLVWTETTTLKLQHKKRTYGTGWSASHEIYDAVLSDMGPALSIGSQGKPTLYVFWAPDEANPTADHVFYKTSTDDGVNWSAPIDWIDESADGFPLPNQQSVFEAQGEFYIGCIWIRTSPDDIRYYEVEDAANEVLNLLGQFIVKQWREDLLGEFDARQEANINLHAAFDGQISLNLKAEFIVRQETSANLLGETIVRQESSVNLLGYWEGQTSVDLLGEAIVRQEASVNLLGYWEGQTSADLLGEVIVRQETSANLLGEVIVRHDNTINLLGEFIVRHESSTSLLGEFIVRQETSVNLLGEVIVRHDNTINLLGEFTARHESSVNLLTAGFVRNAGISNLPSEVIARHSATLNLPALFTARHASTATNGNLPAKFAVRYIYPYWTSRKYINGVIDAAESLIGDAKLEFIIEGVMDDIKVWAEANTVSYTTWMNIEVVPTAIKRATTYGTVAALYARHTKTFQGQVIPTLAPVAVTVTGEQEKAMEHWVGKMEEMLELYLSAQGFERIYISTADEEPVFTMADIPADVTDETSWLGWLKVRET